MIKVKREGRVKCALVKCGKAIKRHRKVINFFYTCFAANKFKEKYGYLKSQCWETSTDNAHCFTLYLNYTSRKVMLINSLMYEGNIQISEYEGTYLTLI